MLIHVNSGLIREQNVLTLLVNNSVSLLVVPIVQQVVSVVVLITSQKILVTRRE